MPFPPWEGATKCTGSATLGAQALMRWIIESYGPVGAMNWGIYNCRSVVGGVATSCHGEGRALDVGFPLGDPDGDRLLRRLLKVPGHLGVQAIIYERTIYSLRSPSGRPYTGAAPHFDHLHVELTQEAGRLLTYETVRRVLTPKTWRAGERDLREGDRGADVRWLQGKLAVLADGIFGSDTAQAVRRFEQDRDGQPFRLLLDGTVGRNTWRSMGVKPMY
jgi:peptidoglycan hydrolase-like protein with peptidoglycan-binding domain